MQDQSKCWAKSTDFFSLKKKNWTLTVQHNESLFLVRLAWRSRKLLTIKELNYLVDFWLFKCSEVIFLKRTFCLSMFVWKKWIVYIFFEGECIFRFARPSHWVGTKYNFGLNLKKLYTFQSQKPENQKNLKNGFLIIFSSLARPMTGGYYRDIICVF